MADAKPAVERLSEDESLRGDLSDIGFGPLLDWAVAAVEAYAPKAAGSEALDAYTSRVRGVVQAAVQAAQDSKLENPEALLDFDPADREKTLAALKAVTFGDDPDQNGSNLAAALQTGLAATATTPSPETASPVKAEEASAPPTEEKAAPTPETTQPSPGEAEPVKKNEPGEQKADQPNPVPNPNPTPAPPVSPVPTSPRPGGFFGDLRSKMDQAYNSAWGVFKGLSKRRNG